MSVLPISYFRQLDRISDENESLLKQMDTYASQLNVVTQEKCEKEKDIVNFKEQLHKSETQSRKAMELEANLICVKETEKSLQSKIKIVELALESEKENLAESNLKISKLSTLLENTQDKLNEEKIKYRRLEEVLESTNKNKKEEELQLVIDNLTDDNSKLVAQAKHLEDKYFSQNKDLDNSKRQEENYKASQTELELKNSTLIEDLNELNEEIKKRGERLDKMEQINKEKADEIKLLEIKNKDKDEAEKAVNELNNSKKELEAATEKLSAVLAEQTSLKKSSTEKIADLEKKVEDLLAGEVKKRAADSAKAEVIEKKYEETAKQLAELRIEYENSINRGEAEQENLRKNTEVVKGCSVEKLEEKVRIIEELQHSSQLKESELETLRLDNSKVYSEVKSLQEQLSKTSREKMKLLQDMEEKSSEILSIRECIEERDITTASKLSKSKEEKDSLEQILFEAKKRCKILEDEVETSKKHALDENNVLKQDIHNLKKTIEELREENSKNRSFNTSNHDIDDTRSEIMSTSTVSRVEEVNRMKDIEDSFEDRYNKLKLIAIKLKKKAADQDKIIKELQASKNGEEGTGNHKEKILTLTKNFGSLQQQYDEAIDKLDSSEAELKQLKKDLEASISENICSKQRSEDAVQEALSAKSEMKGAEERAREAEGQVRSLEITLEQETRERQSLESECRINEELGARLKEKVEENTMIGETLDSLRLQITGLEAGLDREKDRADTAQANLTSTRGQLTQAEADLARLKIEQDEIIIKYEKSVQGTESLQEQLANSIQASDKSGSDMENKLHQLERQITALESSVQIKGENLEYKESELSQVKKEFENYKLRAQSVLKQSKEKVNEEDSSKKKEDIFALEKMNDALNEKLKSLSVELRTLTVERNGIQDEHDRLMSQHSQLMQEAAGKEKAWRERMEQKEVTIKKGEEDQAGIMEKVQKTTETLKQTHRREVEMTKASGAAEISKLKGQLDSAENEVIRLELVLHKEQEARRLAEELLGKAAETGNRFDSKIDIREIEREACEGQEVDSVSHLPPGLNAVTSPLPLDQLLAQADLPGQYFFLYTKINFNFEFNHKGEFMMFHNICRHNLRVRARCTCPH